MQLEPCPACQRHVRTDERVCPFCAAEIADAMARAPKRAQPVQRLGRAALLSFGLSAGAAALTGCDDDGHTVAIYGAPTPPQDASIDASVPRRDSGVDARVPDAKTDASDADAGRDAGPQVVPLYGGPVPIYGAPAPQPKP
jgi:hypothetical protein